MPTRALPAALAFAVACHGPNTSKPGTPPDPTSGTPAGGTSGTTPPPGATSGVPGGTPSTLPRWDGTLAEARDRILEELYTGRDTEAYVPLDPTAWDAFYQLAARLAVGDTDVADLAAVAGYEALLATDDVNGRDVVIVWEDPPTTYRGALMVALDPGARPVVIESPHAGFDGLTGPQGADLFVSLRTRAWMVNTAHRCANAAASGCDGVTTACDPVQSPYRVSDVAHAVDSAFQAWSEGLLDTDPALIAVQNHGFGWTAGEPEAYLSDGTPLPAAPDALVNRLAAELDLVLPVGAASCNLEADQGIATLCATVNTQGRHANQSVDACQEVPTAATGRFLHLEQSGELRGDTGPVNSGLLLAALEAVLPP